MEKNSKIYIAGHLGLVGSALVRQLRLEGYTNLIIKTKKELDLRNKLKVEEFFKKEYPEYVFLAAATVGGIQANVNSPAEFIYDNLQIQNNIIDLSKTYKVKKLMNFSSCCAYPTVCPQPIKEEYFMTGKLEPTNEYFAVAKLAGIGMCQAYNKQYKTNFISVMPSNLYGSNDDFHPTNAHFVSMAIKNIDEAKKKNLKSVTFAGTGKPTRDWLYVDDLAKACIFLMNNYDSSEIINIGTGIGTSKKEIAFMVKEISGYKGELIFDSSKPDGMMQRVLDVSKINSLGWSAKEKIKDGLNKTYDWYKKNIANLT